MTGLPPWGLAEGSNGCCGKVMLRDDQRKVIDLSAFDGDCHCCRCCCEHATDLTAIRDRRARETLEGANQANRGLRWPGMNKTNQPGLSRRAASTDRLGVWQRAVLEDGGFRGMPLPQRRRLMDKHTAARTDLFPMARVQAVERDAVLTGNLN